MMVRMKSKWYKNPLGTDNCSMHCNLARARSHTDVDMFTFLHCFRRWWSKMRNAWDAGSVGKCDRIESQVQRQPLFVVWLGRGTSQVHRRKVLWFFLLMGFQECVGEIGFPLFRCFLFSMRNRWKRCIEWKVTSWSYRIGKIVLQCKSGVSWNSSFTIPLGKANVITVIVEKERVKTSVKYYLAEIYEKWINIVSVSE